MEKKDKPKRVPKRLWDFGVVWEAHIMSRTAWVWDNILVLKRITGDIVDISEWLVFELYDLFCYWDTPHDWDKPNIGRWICVSHRFGSALCYWIINFKTKLLARKKAQNIPKEEVATNEVQYNIQRP